MWAGSKLGMELCYSVGTNQVVDAISAAGGEVFLDLKLKDIPNTVAGQRAPWPGRAS